VSNWWQEKVRLAVADPEWQSLRRSLSFKWEDVQESVDHLYAYWESKGKDEFSTIRFLNIMRSCRGIHHPAIQEARDFLNEHYDRKFHPTRSKQDV
jgi:histone deacetylase complex regulatory component SIN3